MKRFLFIVAATLCLCASASAQFVGGFGAAGFTSPRAVAAGGCSQATAFISRANAITTLDGTHTTAYTNLICGLVADGIYAKEDALYVLATQSVGIAVLNLVSTSFTLTGAGGTFTADRGVTFASSLYDTTYTPSSSGGAYALNSAHIMVWSNTLGDSIGGEFGASGSSNAFFTTNSAVTGSQSAVNQASSFTEHTSSGKGLYLASRTSSSNVDNYWGLSGTLTTIGSSSAVSTNLPNATLDIGAINGFGFSAKQLSAGGFGVALTPTDAANFYARVQTYMTAVGN